ncbi:MAG: 3-phenylpropionate/cinnamic acid dioxygenase subunit beta [Alphaproteobacteria bacterium]
MNLPRDEAYFRLKDEVETFLYDEAEALDERRYDDWLAMLADDLVYFMPMQRNVAQGPHAEAMEFTREQADIHWFEEDKWTLAKRVEQIQTGVHWAEVPISRVVHLVGNVRLVDAAPDAASAETVTVSCRFVVSQNRQQRENYLFVGRRTDTLRRAGNGWQVCRRKVILDQNVLLAKNLTVFF